MSLLIAAWELAESWPVDNVSIGVRHAGGTETFGDIQRSQRIASVSKPLAAWAVLIAVEEGSINMDDAVGQAGCTVRHLLSHAGGYGFDGAQQMLIGAHASGDAVHDNTDCVRGHGVYAQKC